LDASQGGEKIIRPGTLAQIGGDGGSQWQSHGHTEQGRENATIKKHVDQEGLLSLGEEMVLTERVERLVGSEKVAD
ncbi:MAG: hypothetical protein VKP63_00715, partial [Cyanobacteriota bacterium]|nr:hypothetical protein [Cyanobacteriota bacterium]